MHIIEGMTVDLTDGDGGQVAAVVVEPISRKVSTWWSGTVRSFRARGSSRQRGSSPVPEGCRSRSAKRSSSVATAFSRSMPCRDCRGLGPAGRWVSSGAIHGRFTTRHPRSEPALRQRFSQRPN